MLAIDIPGFGQLILQHVVFDYNGTLACDGKLLPGIYDLLLKLSDKFKIHILTADTYGLVREEVKNMPITLHILKSGKEAEQKKSYVQELGCKNVVCFGNGNNDRLMLEVAALGIVVMLTEGCSSATVAAADILVRDIKDGIYLLFQPTRIKATLRY
jgi:soluble P-type ATPase